MDVMKRLEAWYVSVCNEDWEHTYGITISSIDNPGWSVNIDLLDTGLENKSFSPIKIQRENENDWVFCSVKDGKFLGHGGPQNLTEIIEIFLNWVTV